MFLITVYMSQKMYPDLYLFYMRASPLLKSWVHIYTIQSKKLHNGPPYHCKTNLISSLNSCQDEQAPVPG